MPEGLGSALTGLGRFEQAAEVAQQALHVRRELGHPALEAEARAGLARLALAQNDIPAALLQVSEILNYLEGGGSLDGADAPLRIYLTCVEALQAAGRAAPAKELLQEAYQLLQARAARISDADARRLFLENVPWHARIMHLRE